MVKFFLAGLVSLVFLSSLALVNGIKGYRTYSISENDPYYLQFYLEANRTKSREGFAEFCNYTNDNSCFDVADSAPMFRKKLDPASRKAIYSFVYPPHNITGRQLTVLLNYDPIYKENATGRWKVSNNSMFLEYQWTKDKIAKDNIWRLLLQVSEDVPNQSSYEMRTKTTNHFAFGMTLLNLVIAFCVFFGSENPRCCIALIYSLLTIELLVLIPTSRYLEAIIPFLIIFAINFKKNPRIRFILTILAMAGWEIWYYDYYKQMMILAVSLLLSVVFFGVSYWLTKDCNKKLAIISTAYIGSCFPYIIYYAIFMDSLHSSFSHLIAARHIVALAGVAFQAKVLKKFDELFKIPEEVSLLGNDRAINLNNAHALNNNFL